MTDISKKINESGAGVKSSVVESADGKVSLQIEGEKTGKDNGFKIEDKNGDMAAKAGLKNVTQMAGDAKYKVDDKEFTSATNEIKLDKDRVNVSLKAVGETKITVGENKEATASAIKKFVQSYNDTVNKLNENSTNENAAKMSSDLTRVAKNMKASLDNVGIQVSDQGLLSIDEEKLKVTLDKNPNQVKNILSSDTGLGKKVEKIATEAIDKNVSSLISATNQTSTQSSTNPFENAYNYMSTAQKTYLNKAQQTGVLFDAML